jgi:outer membrane protein W
MASIHPRRRLPNFKPETWRAIFYARAKISGAPMRSLRTFYLLLSLVSATLAAQGNAGVDIGVWASKVNLAGGETPKEDSRIELADASGFGVSVRFDRGGRLSTELAVFSFSSEARLTSEPSDPAFSELGSLRVTPVTATIQFHPGQWRLLRPFVGGGVAYVLSGELAGRDSASAENRRIEVDDELTWVASAGVDFSVNPALGVGLDARYIPLKVGFRTRGAAEDGQLRLSPWIVSVGARFRF